MLCYQVNQKKLLKFIKGDDYFVNVMLSFLWLHALNKGHKFANLRFAELIINNVVCYAFEQIDIKCSDNTNSDEYIYIYTFYLKDEASYYKECKISIQKYKDDYVIVRIIQDYNGITEDFCEKYALKRIPIIKIPLPNTSLEEVPEKVPLPDNEIGYLFGIKEFIMEYQLKRDNQKCKRLIIDILS